PLRSTERSPAAPDDGTITLPAHLVAGKLLTWMGSSVSVSLAAVLPSSHFDREVHVRRRRQSRRWVPEAGYGRSRRDTPSWRVSVASPTQWLLFPGASSATPSPPAQALSLFRIF